MAALAACKRLSKTGTNSWMTSGVRRFKGGVPPLDTSMFLPSAIRFSTSPSPFSQCRHVSQQLVKSNGKRLFLVDTLALVRRFEAEGLPSKQAEAITTAITEVLNGSLENLSLSVVSRTDMQKSNMIQESNLSKLKSEVQSSQEHHYSLLQHENEKLRHDIEKMRSELRHEIDKVTAEHRLDLNLERGRIRDELTNQSAVTSNLTNTLDREIHTLKAHLEGAKYDLIKYCIGTLVSISTVGLAMVRILMQ
ncbi:coiled-coil domain-containing protein 90B, mitochondrial-like [Hibiscus syriacus]|uniref:coiled-coil domain-containing protein 90B, mitochondrial-like n=1 Tax=Hibiscus syriacus TaxID=106335 RepID=UPI0019215323|nr:coiled-coil domain-containing protein 90B, mitochondrial-like [Hibiscus syriacus]